MSRNALPAASWMACSRPTSPGFARRTETASGAGVTGTGFRAAFNERGNVLFTTTGPLSEDAGAPGLLVFPHIAEGGGYTTQFVVISGAAGQKDSGLLRFFNQQGNPLNVTLSNR